eukprot:scaffold15633_cov60-Phaeocystis_antarctica.AAC.11
MLLPKSCCLACVSCERRAKAFVCVVKSARNSGTAAMKRSKLVWQRGKGCLLMGKERRGSRRGEGRGARECHLAHPQAALVIGTRACARRLVVTDERGVGRAVAPRRRRRARIDADGALKQQEELVVELTLMEDHRGAGEVIHRHDSAQRLELRLGQVAEEGQLLERVGDHGHLRDCVVDAVQPLQLLRPPAQQPAVAARDHVGRAGTARHERTLAQQ